jgi:hypothetical protein
MLDHLTVSPYLCQPLDKSYRDVLDEQIIRLESERRHLEDKLVMLREERKRLGDRE